MMDHAMRDIKNSKVLIAETTYKGIGIGIEVRYAKAKGIPVIYLRQKNAEHSTTFLELMIVPSYTKQLKSWKKNLLMFYLN